MRARLDSVGSRRLVSLLLAVGVFVGVAVVAVGLRPSGDANASGASAPASGDSAASTSYSTTAANGATTITLQATHAYQPKAPPGATDDYHCTLVDPRVRENSMIVSSEFFPESDEVHHAILFLVPPDLAAAARRADGDGKGWTCFGESPLPGTSLAQISNTPWLAAWAPGHGVDTAPKGTGTPLPAGSLVVMQIHYNLLVGDKPVRAKLVLHTVPATEHLQPLRMDLLPAPPDIPCPAGVTGPLCNRAASLANLGQRFGQSAVDFVNTLEQICGRNPVDPPGGDSTSCTWGVGFTGKIVRLTAHMHLLGRGMQVVLNPGTPQAKTLLDVTDYNFDYQRSYDIAPVSVSPGDKIGVTCTYDPTLRQELPSLRKLPPRYVTWGDGSSDEMCLAIIQYVA